MAFSHGKCTQESHPKSWWATMLIRYHRDSNSEINQEYLYAWESLLVSSIKNHDDVIKWIYFPCYWPFVRGIHRSPVNSPHKGQRRGALIFSLICTRINGWVNNGEAGDLRRYRAHFDFTVMIICGLFSEVTANRCDPKNITLSSQQLSGSVHILVYNQMNGLFRNV